MLPRLAASSAKLPELRRKSAAQFTIPARRSPRPAGTDPAPRYPRTALLQELRETASFLIIGSSPVGVNELIAVARGERPVRLDSHPAFRARIAAAAQAVESRLGQGAAIYGVTTGVGASVDNEILPEHRAEMPYHLMRFHGCGTGPILSETEAAAVVAIRLACLAKGRSGVRVELLEALCNLLNHRILPRIPERGSVGASGDLTPLSYLTAALVGEREVSWRGRILPAAEALRQAGLEPVSLAPEGEPRAHERDDRHDGARVPRGRARGAARAARGGADGGRERGDAREPRPLRRAHLRLEAAPGAAAGRARGSARTSSAPRARARAARACRTATRSAARRT